MTRRVHICLDLPGDAVFEQIFNDFGRVTSTTLEADLTVGELHMALSELEHALKEYAWENPNEENK